MYMHKITCTMYLLHLVLLGFYNDVSSKYVQIFSYHAQDPSVINQQDNDDIHVHVCTCTCTLYKQNV